MNLASQENVCNGRVTGIVIFKGADLLTYHGVHILQALPVGVIQDTALWSCVVT